MLDIKIFIWFCVKGHILCFIQKVWTFESIKMNHVTVWVMLESLPKTAPKFFFFTFTELWVLILNPALPNLWEWQGASIHTYEFRGHPQSSVCPACTSTRETNYFLQSVKVVISVTLFLFSFNFQRLKWRGSRVSCEKRWKITFPSS